MRSWTISSTENCLKIPRHLGRYVLKQLNIASREVNCIEDPSMARCLGASEANYIKREAHEGICGNYSGAECLVLKLIMNGYYWSRVEQDAKAYVQKCDNYQRHAPLVHQSAELLHSDFLPWSFMKWGMDIVDPLLPAPGKVLNRKLASAKR
ncbi:PREDICTED: uncharacterized protein LOC109238109 [Nicotiana attenuata]|uniref:uncharacterized protein LOC109238109 n=1 Tax=Nicotiana attenuata TaxID=49451 RepID=UPI0009053B13|nr:PREDICTED: uncharacterized protein LOC109238109 [Nicotiana attenuata]